MSNNMAMTTQEQTDRAYAMAESWANNPDRLYQMLATKASPDQMKQICGHLTKAFAALSDVTVSNERTVREASTAILMIYGVIVELVMLPTAEQIIFNEQNMVLSNWPGRIAA